MQALSDSVSNNISQWFNDRMSIVQATADAYKPLIQPSVHWSVCNSQKRQAILKTCITG